MSDSHPRHESAQEPAAEEPLPLALARTEIPLAVGFLGGVNILYGLGGGIAMGFSNPAQVAVSVTGGAVLIFGSVILGHHRMNPRALMWGWAIACTTMVVKLLWDSHRTAEDLPVFYGMLIMVFAVPVTLAWAPALTGGLLMFAAIVVGHLVLLDDGDNVFIVVLAALALAIGVVLLELRLSMVAKMARHEEALEAVAATDPVIGSLSRRGILSLADGVADTAERMESSAFVLMVKIGDLAELNRLYGYEYGDYVLRTAAEVLHGCCHPGDLVGRWTGSRFVVLGIGEGPQLDTFSRHVVEGIRASGMDIGKIPVTVKVGTCTAEPRSTTFEDMVAAAEQHLKSQRTQDAGAAGGESAAESGGSGTRV